MSDVFISYSRRDADFAHRLVQALSDHDRNVWVDFEDIPFGTDWWSEIVTGIESAAVCLFVISPDSMRSDICSLEVNHMLKTRKRIIPIFLRADSQQSAEDQKVPAAIRDLNWLSFENPDTFDDAFQRLLTTIGTDLDDERERARLLLKAREWDARGNDNSFLLRGEELRQYLTRLSDSNLTDLQRAYLQKSQRYHDNLQLFLRFVWGFFGGVMGMAYFIALTFRVDNLFSPVPIAIAVAAGEVFGLFIGIVAALSYGLPGRLRRLIPVRGELAFRGIAAVIIAVMAWVVFQWFFLNLPLEVNPTNLIGGVGLAFGFIVAIFTRLPVILLALVTAIATFLPVYLLNNLSSLAVIRTGELDPLIYFDSTADVWRVGLPMALFIAIGAYAPQLWGLARRWLSRPTPSVVSG